MVCSHCNHPTEPCDFIWDTGLCYLCCEGLYDDTEYSNEEEGIEEDE